jgi:hypothetical protein
MRPRMTLRLSLPFFLIVAGGCGGSSGGTGGTGGSGAHTGTGGMGGTGGSGGGSGGAGGSAGTGGVGGVGGSGGTSGTGGTGGTGGVGGIGGSGGGTGGSGGSGQTCGGLGDQMCGSAEFCNWMDNSCGAADGTGTCQGRPGACPTVYDPVCACNGQVYPSECDANAAGFDVNSYGGCTPPAGMFGCGWGFCPHGTSYCQKVVGGAFGNPGSYTCEPLPSACGSNPGCACLSGVTCGSQCQQSAGGDMTVSCFVP